MDFKKSIQGSTDADLMSVAQEVMSESHYKSVCSSETMRKKDQTALALTLNRVFFYRDSLSPVYTIWKVSPLSHPGTQGRVFPL